MARTTDKREAILRFITDFMRNQGYPPSVREICAGVGLASTATVHYHLNALKEEGLIHMDGKKNRTISLPEECRSGSIPIVGVVTAGQPILAEENVEEYIPIPEAMLGDGTHFILLVKGESMIQAGIMDGDYVVVRKQPEANNGDIVVAMIEDSATVKRFYKENGHFRLQPENPTMEPIYTKELTILGKVVSLYRIL